MPAARHDSPGDQLGHRLGVQAVRSRRALDAQLAAQDPGPFGLDREDLFHPRRVVQLLADLRVVDAHVVETEPQDEHQRRRATAGQGMRIPVRDQSSAGDDDHAICRCLDLAQDVRREQHGLLATELAHERAHPHDLARVEAAGRLVEDEHIGIPEQRLGEADALPEALREGTDRPAGMHTDPACVDDAADLATALAAIETVQTGHELEVPIDAHGAVERRGLGQVPDAPATLGVPGSHELAGDLAATAIGHERAREDLHRRGLPGAVGAQETHDRAALDVERDAVERNQVTVALEQAACVDHRLKLTLRFGVDLEALQELSIRRYIIEFGHQQLHRFCEMHARQDPAQGVHLA